MSEQKLTTGAAFALMEAGEVLEWRDPAGDTWAEQRIHGGRLEYRVPGETWLPDGSHYSFLASGKWRRVPKTPSLGELAAKWKNEVRFGYQQCADDLDAALREGDYVPREAAIAAMQYVADLHIGSAIDRQEALERFSAQLLKRAVRHG